MLPFVSMCQIEYVLLLYADDLTMSTTPAGLQQQVVAQFVETFLQAKRQLNVSLANPRLPHLDPEPDVKFSRSIATKWSAFTHTPTWALDSIN